MQATFLGTVQYRERIDRMLYKNYKLKRELCVASDRSARGTGLLVSLAEIRTLCATPILSEIDKQQTRSAQSSEPVMKE